MERKHSIHCASQGFIGGQGLEFIPCDCGVSEGEQKMDDKYEISQKMEEQLEKTFTYHAPKDDQPERYVFLRDAAKALAYLIVYNTPPSREQSLAITHLEEAIFYANAAIARNEK